MCMPNKQKMQNYGYFDILYFKDRSDRDRIAIRPQDRGQFFFSDRDQAPRSRSVLFRITILGTGRDPKKFWTPTLQ